MNDGEGDELKLRRYGVGWQETGSASVSEYVCSAIESLKTREVAGSRS